MFPGPRRRIVIERQRGIVESLVSIKARDSDRVSPRDCRAPSVCASVCARDI